MSDKNSNKPSGKFPYIVLPTLSSPAEDNLIKSGGSNSNEVHKNHNHKSSAVMKPKSPSPFGQRNTATANNKNPSPPPTSNPPPPSSPVMSVGLSRHIALSKQFNGKGTGSGDVRELFKESKGSPSYTDKSYSPSSNSNLDFEALSQLLPQARTSRSSGRLSKPLQHNNRVLHHQVPIASVPASPSSSSSSIQQGSSSADTLDWIKSRVDSLAIYVKKNDSEISKLKGQVKELQNLLKDKKEEDACINKVMEQLSIDMQQLCRKLDNIEDKLVNQERNIMNKILLMDELGSEAGDGGGMMGGLIGTEDDHHDHDEEFFDKRNWHCSGDENQDNNNHTNCATRSGSSCWSTGGMGLGISSLKECVNWVPIAPDFDKLVNVISLMNFKMDRNQSMRLTRNGNAAGFKNADTVQLTLYKNGLTLGTSGGFRPYSSLSVIKMINEIFGGYFPTELQPHYPDGVVFVVTDKRTVAHDICPGFNGPGVKLSEARSAVPSLLPGSGKLDRKKAKQKDLSKSTSSSFTIRMNNRPVEPETKPVLLPDFRKHARGSKLIMLKLKNISNGHIYRVKVPTSCTINELASHLEKHLLDEAEIGKGQGDSIEANHPKFDIILPLPYGVLCSQSSTLEDYDLVTNTLLYIQPKEKECQE